VGHGDSLGYRVRECNDKGFEWSMWLGFQLAYVFLFLVWGTVNALKTRNVQTAFNESWHIAVCVFSLVFFGVVLVPLQLLVSGSPNALVLIRGVGQSLGAIIISLVLFAPKMLALWLDENDATAKTTAAPPSSGLRTNPTGNSHSNTTPAVSPARMIVSVTPSLELALPAMA
jgi:hypothetical protein